MLCYVRKLEYHCDVTHNCALKVEKGEFETHERKKNGTRGIFSILFFYASDIFIEYF